MPQMQTQRPTRLPVLSVVVLFLVALTAACTGHDPSAQGDTDGPAGLGTRVTGRLIDDETGAAVSRTSIYVHAFHDADTTQVSLKPTNDPTFELTIPGDVIRLRIPDLSHEYELFEQTFTAQNGVIDVDVRLTPTHWVQVRGKVLWRDGDQLRPVSEGDGNVRSARVSMGPGGHALSLGADGSYTRRVPRQLLHVLTVNTNRSPNPREIDLAGFTGDEYEQDVILEPR